MADGVLQCPRCGGAFSAEGLLEACTVAEPETGLLRVACPRCAEGALVRLLDGRVELGPAPADGALFRASSALDVPELFVRRDPAWVDCWLRKVYRRYPVAG